jgi:hypothetical protein
VIRLVVLFQLNKPHHRHLLQIQFIVMLAVVQLDQHRPIITEELLIGMSLEELSGPLKLLHPDQ